MDRSQIADQVLARLAALEDRVTADVRRPGRVGSFVVDDLMAPDLAASIHAAFPPLEQMHRRKSLREHKYVGVQVDAYDPLCEEALYAFQDPRVVALLGRVLGVSDLHPDPQLYAGGLSSMVRDQFLNPHIDNSHDHERQRYRVLNLLYYVTPDWSVDHGGHLELWDGGLEQPPRVIHNNFNRLVAMITHDRSWHSVQRVQGDGRRNCVSNYYFSAQPVQGNGEFHVTSFRGRPEEPLRDGVLRLDGAVRGGLRRIWRQGVRPTTHIYQKRS